MLRNRIYGTVLLIAGLTACRGSLNCLDESGAKVDWWAVYKLPHNKSSDNDRIYDGTGYLYIDSSHTSHFTLSGKPITSDESCAGHTLSQIYHSSQEVGYAMYNDEEPDQTKDFFHAHSKGTVGYDSDSGFWLVHSVPRFPNYADKSYLYPESGTVYGQSMLCISLPLAGIDLAGRQFQTNGPHFYDSYMPKSLHNSLSELYDATNNKTVNDTTYNIEALTSTGGTHFTSFAKSKDFGKDLYSDLVAPSLKKALMVESWVRGESVPTCCSPKCPYDVFNVTKLDFGEEAQFTEYQDHSKWAVATDKSALCIGDINRMYSQFHRGGGTVCFENSDIASLYQKAVVGYSPCPHGGRDRPPGSQEIHVNHKILF